MEEHKSMTATCILHVKNGIRIRDLIDIGTTLLEQEIEPYYGPYFGPLERQRCAERFDINCFLGW